MKSLEENNNKFTKLSRCEKIEYIFNNILNNEHHNYSKVLFPKDKLNRDDAFILIDGIVDIIDGISYTPNENRFLLLDNQIICKNVNSTRIVGASLKKLIINVIDEVKSISYTTIYDISYDTSLDRYEIRLLISDDHKKVLRQKRDDFILSIIN